MCSDNSTVWIWLLAILAIANFWVQHRAFSGTRRSQRTIHAGNATLLTVFLAALTLAVAFVAIGQTPYWFNAGVYMLAFAIMVGCSRLAKLDWTDFGRSLAVAGALLYLIFFAQQVVMQHNREHDIGLEFKSSISDYRKFLIRHDLSEYRDYFARLGIPIPQNVPPVGIDYHNRSCFSTANVFNQPLFRSEILIGVDCLTREQATLLYGDWVAINIPSSKPARLSPQQLGFFAMARDAFVTYFNRSFWDRRIAHGCPGHDLMGGAFASGSLWQIRERLGKEFTDRAVAYAMLSTADDPLEGMNDDLRVYVGRKLKIGVSVIDDASGTNWRIVSDILRNGGFNVNKI